MFANKFWFFSNFLSLCSLVVVVGESVILTNAECKLLESHQDIYSQKSWKLVYRASRDGDRGKNFHEKCDNLSPILVIIKSKNYNSVFGCFSHLPFDSGYHYIHDAKKKNWLYLVRFDNMCNRVLPNP